MRKLFGFVVLSLAGICVLVVGLAAMISFTQPHGGSVVLAQTEWASNRCGMAGLYALDDVIKGLTAYETEVLLARLNGEGIHIQCGGLGGCVYATLHSRCLP